MYLGPESLMYILNKIFIYLWQIVSSPFFTALTFAVNVLEKAPNKVHDVCFQLHQIKAKSQLSFPLLSGGVKDTTIS